MRVVKHWNSFLVGWLMPQAWQHSGGIWIKADSNLRLALMRYLCGHATKAYTATSYPVKQGPKGKSLRPQITLLLQVMPYTSNMGLLSRTICDALQN